VSADVPLFAVPKSWRDGVMFFFGELRSMRVPLSAASSSGKVTRSISYRNQMDSIMIIEWARCLLDSEAPLI
jgi:hypothetical protein